MNIIVKLQLSNPLTPEAKPICKRVVAGNFNTLMLQAAKIAERANKELECLRYNDGHDWVMVEDDLDLQFAYEYATITCKQQT